MGLTIGQCIDDLQGTEVVRVRECTYYDGLAVCLTQIVSIRNITADGLRRMGLIVVSKATTVELNHHIIQIRLQFRQNEIGIEVFRTGIYTQRLAVVTSRLKMTLTVRIERSEVVIALRLHQPLVSVNRHRIGNAGGEASRFEVCRVRRNSL